VLFAVARLIRQNLEELAQLDVRSVGKPIADARDEVALGARVFEYYAGAVGKFFGHTIPVARGGFDFTIRQPMGVVAAIVPWNFPFPLACWKVAPALAAGNVVVCKPSELTPLSTLALADCFEHLPAGTVSILAGAGDVGAAIAANEHVDCVAFTGSVATGKKVALACAQRVARVNLEMGGKDPFIVCADVAGGLDVAARGGAWPPS